MANREYKPLPKLERSHTTHPTPTACAHRYTDSSLGRPRFVALPAALAQLAARWARLTATPTACVHRYTDSSWDGAEICGAASRVRTLRGPLGRG